MEKDLGRIKKNDTTDIVVRIDDFGGRKGLTIREFVTSDRYSGFTKAGTRIPAEHFISFREMINSITLDDMKQDPNAVVEKKFVPRQQKTLKDSVKKPAVSDDEDLADDLPDY